MNRTWLKTPTLGAPWLVAWAGVFAVITALAQVLGEAPPWHLDSAVQYDSDLAVCVGMGWTIFQIALHRHDAPMRHRWIAAAVAMLLLATVQATDWLVDWNVLADDWLVDLPLWVLASAIVRAVLREPRSQPWTLGLWRVGLALQLVFIVCDLLEGRSIPSWSLTADDLAALSEWTELLAIECYVVALVLSGSVGMPRALRQPGASLAVGEQARRVYRDAHLFRRAVYPPVRLAFYPGVRQLLLGIACLVLVAMAGPAARRASRRSLRGQLRDLLALSLRRGFDPMAYYFQELYRPGGLDEAAHYLTRDETKNGLFNVLNRTRYRPHRGHEMNDKRLFARCCVEAGLSVPPTLMSCDVDGADWLADRDAFDRDLFCKPLRGRGARGTLLFRRIAFEHYRTRDGDVVDLDELVSRLERIGRGSALVVQPRLRNHDEVAMLASDSLVTIRVLTCQDAGGRPIVTHGFVRVLSRLEPSWTGSDEYGAPIDLETGRLGSMISDRLMSGGARFARHPVTDARVEGRVLMTWPAIKVLATRAHRAFAHRVLIGWDIASTDHGVVLLEGNTNLDVMFPQRVHGEGFGRSPLGPLLAHHLTAVAQEFRVE